MSKNVSIKEGDRARNFGPTAKIKTDLQAGGSCYWVPEDERETGHIFASENREYTPDEINKYGIDSIDVNIIFTGTTADGDPWSVTIDPDTGLPIIDIDDVEITIDDVTGDIDISTPDTDITIDDADLDDFGIDPDADIDISMDDLGNIEISDGDISVDFDPETGEWDTSDCPASIKIMHVPTKTSYKDGEAIDLDGLVVQALDAEGNPWKSDKYPDGYIPVHDLMLPTSRASEEESSENIGIADGVPYLILSCLTYQGGNYFAPYHPYSGPVVDSKGPMPETMNERWVGYAATSAPGDVYLTMYNGIVFTKTLYGINATVVYCMEGDTGEGRGTNPFRPGMQINIPESSVDPTGKSVENIVISGSNQKIDVVWVSPCFESLVASFDIAVTPRGQGTHHSGKF